MANDAQGLTFDLGYLTTSGTAVLYAYVATGPNYTMPGTATKSFLCNACNTWVTGMIDLTAFRGQSIKVKFVYGGGVIGLDRIRPQIIFPGYSVVSTSYVRDFDGSDPYAWVKGGDLITDAFTVDPTAQFLSVHLRGLSTFSDQAQVIVLSGATFATSTTFNPVFGDSWSRFDIDATPWKGAQIKLKVHVTLNTVGIDDLGVGQTDFSNWSVSGTPDLVTGTPTGTALDLKGATLFSDAFVLPEDAQQLSARFSPQTVGAGFHLDLLRGPSFATVIDLNTGPIYGTVGQWSEFKAAIAAYAGETVKLRIRPTLGQMYLDDIGLREQVVPGWSLSSISAAVVTGADANGTYLTAWKPNTSLTLESSLINPGIPDARPYPEGRSYLVSYAIGTTTGSMVKVWWIPEAGQSYLVYADAADSPTGFKNGRFAVTDDMASPGHFEVTVTDLGKIYSIGDNVARQQLSEPFTQQVGAGIDTSTGSFGLSDVDISIEGGPLPLTFARYYHGHSDRSGVLGARWTHTFETFAASYVNGDVAIVFGSGKEEVFRYDVWEAKYFPLDPRVPNTLVKLPTGAFQYTTRDDLVYNFTAAGDLISLVDASGNAIVVYRNPQGADHVNY